LLFTFVPSLRPGGGSDSTSVSANIPGTKDRATISLEDDAVTQLTYADYLRELGVPQKFATGNLRQAGIVIKYRLEFPGFPKGTPFRIRYDLQRIKQGEATLVRQQRQSVRLDADRDYCICTSDFIALPRGESIYRVEIAVFRPRAEFSEPVVEAPTDPFAGTA
jgi:hypothetical protein